MVVDARMINSSGIGVYLKNILPEIVKKYELVLLGDTKELSKLSWTKDVKIIHFTASIYSLKEQFYFPFIIPKTDLFWCPHFNAPLFPLRAKRMLTTIYDVNHLANKKSNSFFKWLYAKLLYNSAVIRSSKVITISEFSKKELLKYTYIKKNKIHVIFCGVDYDIFSNKKNSIVKNLPENYILFVGNIKPHKNLITLLKAYNKLSEKIKTKFKLVILGKKEGFITPDLKIFRFIEDNNLLKHTFFTGYIEDDEVPGVYQRAKLFVFPSLYEGFGLPILEAMVSKVPVLSSNLASLPEVGGDSVLYFDPNNPDKLAKIIEESIEDENLLNQLIEKGKIQAKLFSWSISAKEHIKTIDTLLDK